MRANKIEKEHEQGNEIVGRFKRAKPLLSLVPGLKLLVEALDEIVGNIISKALDSNMLYSVKQ